MDEVTPGACRRRSTAGRTFPADPPRVDEIIAGRRAAGNGPYGLRLRALIVILCAQAFGSARHWPSPRPTSSRLLRMESATNQQGFSLSRGAEARTIPKARRL